MFQNSEGVSFMDLRKPSVAFSIAAFFLVVLLTGCGGNQSDDSSQNGSSGGTQNNKGGRTSVETKVAIGRVAVAGPDRRLIVRSSTGDQSNKRLVFGVAKKAKITLDGKEATLEDARKGQQVQVKYFVKNDRNRAAEIVLFGRASSPPPGGTTG